MRAGRRWWSVSDVLLILLPALTLMACEGWQADRAPMAPSTEPATAPSSVALLPRQPVWQRNVLSPRAQQTYQPQFQVCPRLCDQ